jgi:hypothetical protein
MRFYRASALVLAVSFVFVGLLFLFFPDTVIHLFNALGAPLGLPQAPTVGFQFYLALASGYMYVVSLLAWLMFRHPERGAYARLLAHAKLATSLLSLGFFVFHSHFLIYLANFLVDGLIALGVWVLLRSKKRWVL